MILMVYVCFQGAYCGVFVGVSCTLWLAIGAFMYPPNKHAKVVRLTECSAFNTTSNSTTINPFLNGTGIIRPEEEYTDLE